MKRKVQAQRKFAQGVYIPPMVSERRHDRTPQKDQVQPEKTAVSTYCNNTKVGHLLDMIAFQNIHKHKPHCVVVLERLQDKCLSIEKPDLEHQLNGHAPVSQLTVRTEERLPDVTPPTRPESVEQKTKKLNQAVKTSNSVQVLRKSVPEITLKKANNIKIRKQTNGVPDSPSPQKEKHKEKQKPKLTTKKDLKSKFIKPTLRAVKKTVMKPLPSPVSRERLKRKVTALSKVGYDSSTDDDQPLKQLYLHKNKMKILKKKILKNRLPGRSLRNKPFTRSAYKQKCDRQKKGINLKMKKPVPSDKVAPATDQPETDNSLYSGTNIEDWVDKTVSTVTKQTAEFVKPKVPENVTPKLTLISKKPLKKKARLSGDKDKPQTAARDTTAVRDKVQSPCPSSIFQSISTLEDTANINMADCCKKCSNCEILKIIFEKNCSATQDVYTFDPELETAAGPAQYRPRRPSSNRSDEHHCLYLDMFDERCPYLVQIVKVFTQDKRLIRARVVSKVDVDKALVTKCSEDLSLYLNQANFLKDLSNSFTHATGKLVADDARAGVKEKPTKKSDKRPRKSDSPAQGAFPKPSENGRMVDAPVYRPTPEEFENALEYIEKIRPEAEKFGLCKIVPPAGFSPTCVPPDDLSFLSTNQYICKMYMRWAAASREMCAIKSHLATQNVIFKRAPLIDGVEVNLAKLYNLVQRSGGLKVVLQKKKWTKIAEEMNYGCSPKIEKKLDNTYVKYVLPYDTLTNNERQEIMKKVETQWNKRFSKMLKRARNPLHRQKRLLGESSSEDEEEESGESCLDEAEDCVVPGRTMNLPTFKKIAARTMDIQFPQQPQPSPGQVEQAYWQHVMFGHDHICVNTASIDTGEKGYGFTKAKNDPYSKHPWNLKVLSNSSGSILRSMGPVLSVTVPTLHLGMLFATSCWHKDPHGLPWIEYLHEGPPKIWYGIPDEQSEKFRKAVETLAPAYCQNKGIWLPSDIAMFPPQLLLDNHVSLSKTHQEAGQYIVVFPKAYSSSVCTGFCVSESIYFAPSSWLSTMQSHFQEVRESCEPTMFPLERLLVALCGEPRVARSLLLQVHNALDIAAHDERALRLKLRTLGVPVQEIKVQTKKKWNYSWNVGEHTECDICRKTLYLSKVSGVTNKKSDLCLPHALRVLEMKSSSELAELNKNISLICFYTDDALDDIIMSLRARIQAS